MKQDKATTSIPVKYVSVDGREYPLNESQTEVQYKGQSYEVMEDQEGWKYITIGYRQQPVYIGLPPSPSIPVKIKVGDKMKFNKDSDTVTCIEVSKDGKSVKSSGGQWYDMEGTILVSSIPVNDELDNKGNVFVSGGMVDGYSVVQNSDLLFDRSPLTRHAHTTLKMMCESFNETYQKGFNPAAMEELYKALDKAVGYLADLNGSNWITGEDAGSLDMKQRAKWLQSILYTALHNAKTIKK